MEIIPAQEIPSQQIPIQPGATLISSPVQKPPQKTNLRKFFNISSWFVLFALLPLTVLIFLSQDSIPGDLFYPVKRSLENVVLAAASVSPVTRAAFRTDLTATRFKEAQSLVISKSNASGLSTFVDEVQAAKLEVTNLQNNTERTKAEEKLTLKIEEYQNGLSTLEAKTEQNLLTSAPNLPSVTPTFTPAPTLIPTSTPIPTLNPLPSSKPQPTSTLTPISPSTLAPTVVPTTPPQSGNTQITEQKKIAQTIKETKEQLHKIKKDLEEKRNEDRQKEDKRSENQNKDNSNKKTETPDRQK